MLAYANIERLRRRGQHKSPLENQQDRVAVQNWQVDVGTQLRVHSGCGQDGHAYVQTPPRVVEREATAWT